MRRSTRSTRSARSRDTSSFSLLPSATKSKAEETIERKSIVNQPRRYWRAMSRGRITQVVPWTEDWETCSVISTNCSSESAMKSRSTRRLIRKSADNESDGSRNEISNGVTSAV